MAKTEKTCIVCGTKFLGTAKAQVCTDKSNCRVKLKRLLAKGQKPPFALIAATKTKPSQKTKELPTPKKEVKIQDLNHPTNEVANLTKEPPKTNYTIQRPFMNDAIRKKLGIS